MDRFVGREGEIARLQAQKKEKKSTISIIYGRRRVGKSELIRRAFKDDQVFYFEGLENQGKAKQISNFISQLKFQTKKEIPSQHEEWREAFMELIDVIKGKSIVLVFDEFQWMANYRSEIISDLKMIWDQYLKDTGHITLILCGSIASFMITKVVQSSAFYGRSDLVIHLQPFDLQLTAQMLTDKSAEEVIESYMVLGGIPKYLELINREPSLILGMQNLAFTPDAYFVEEYNRIFTSHFGKGQDYKKIVEALARHPYGLTRLEISNLSGVQMGGGLSKQIFNLEASGFILPFWPYHKAKNTKNIRYCLTDSYLRFYFAMIKPNLGKIKKNLDDIFLRLVGGQAYASWLGRSFEYLCHDHAKKISALLGFSGIDYNFGPYFKASTKGHRGIQIDLLFDRADRVITLCEIKYTRQAPGVNIIEETEKKAILLGQTTTKTIQKVLITKTPPSAELMKKGYFYRVILAEELI